MGIQIGRRHNISIGGSAGRSWTPQTLVVENAAPTKVVLTGLKANTNLVASNFTIAGFTVLSLSRDATNKILTLTLSTEVQYMDALIVKIKSKPYHVTNNVLSYSMLLTSTGTGSGVSTMQMQSSSDITITLGANAKFYTDAAGTIGESSIWTILSGESRTIYIKCTTGTALAKISDITKITIFGEWTSSTNAPSIKYIANRFSNLITLGHYGNCEISGAMPATLTRLQLISLVKWSYSGALPDGLTYAWLEGANINWQYNGALPSNITVFRLLSMPSAWIYDGLLPSTLVDFRLAGINISFTGLDFSGSSNVVALILTNFRTDKMSSVDMVTLLTSLTNRVGSLPATITINDYADYASPPTAVTNAVATLKSTKNVTTVNLGA